MATYCINQTTYEVHSYGCPYLPCRENRQRLGRFTSLRIATAAARAVLGYLDADRCDHCWRREALLILLRR